MAQAGGREALSIAGVASAAQSPEVNGELSIKREHWADNVFYGPGPLANQDTWNNVGTIGLSYRLDLWGKDKNSAELALDVAHASAADPQTAQLELDSNIIRTYIGMSLYYPHLGISTTILH